MKKTLLGIINKEYQNFYESGVNMTVKSDLQKAVAAAESAKGTYLMAAQSTQDATAKEQYEAMASTVDSHIAFINSRLNTLGSLGSNNYD